MKCIFNIVMKNDLKYIKRTIQLSEIAHEKGELPFGCVITYRSKIVMEAHDMTQIDNDLTQHAEIVALKAMQKKYSTTNLSKYTIYCSREPCAMCSFMIREFKLGKVVFSIESPIMGGYTRFKVLQDEGLEKLDRYYSRPPKVIGKILQDEAMIVWNKRRILRNKS